jgi:hypothetical protein
MAQVAGPVTIVKQGCFDADVVNALNANIVNTSFPNAPTVAATFSNSAIPFGNYTTAGTAVTLLAAGHPAGTYRVTMYAVITTTFATAANVGHTLGYTDDQGARTQTNTLGALVAGTTLSSVGNLRSTGATALTVTEIAGTSNATAGVMALSVIVERVI